MVCRSISAFTPDVPEKNRFTRKGVIKIPRKFDIEALHTAADTFPFAMEVKAIDDWTVDGRKHRYRTPKYSNSFPPVKSGEKTGFNRNPVSGNTTKVEKKTSRCNRQLIAPCMIAWRESLAPWIKNKAARLTSVSRLKPSYKIPLAGRGNTIDSKITAVRARRKPSTTCLIQWSEEIIIFFALMGKAKIIKFARILEPGLFFGENPRRTPYAVSVFGFVLHRSGR